MLMQENRCPQLYEKYRIQSQIGRGASATCYKIHNILTKQQFAMKKIHITSIKKQNTKQACLEVQILSKINHPNIIKLYQFFTDETNIYIIMQYASKGDLHHIIKRKKMKNEIYTESDVWAMAFQLLSAIQYLHKHNIIHRDVKTLNIFMDNQDKLYLGDLGVSKILKVDTGLYSRVGTPLYLAPQIIKYEKYDYKADIWSLGCVFYQIATMNHPFQGKNIISLGQNIVGSSPKYMQKMSIELNQLILDMLEKTPYKRLSAQDLLTKYFKGKLINMPKLGISMPNNRKKLDNPIIEQVLKEQTKQKQKANYSILKLPLQNKIKHRAINNYVNISLNSESCHKDKAEQRKKQQKIFKQKIIGKYIDETVEFTKKISNNAKQQKDYSELTHKNNIGMQQIVNIELSFDKPQQLIYDNCPQSDKNSIIKDKGRFFTSEKKFKPAATTNNIPLYHKIQDLKLKNYNNQHLKRKTQMFTSDNNDQFPSSTQLIKPNKVQRNRPKSSIMTKQRHESTMKNIRKNISRQYYNDESIQTCYLKKPQMIIL